MLLLPALLAAWQTLWLARRGAYSSSLFSPHLSTPCSAVWRTGARRLPRCLPLRCTPPRRWALLRRCRHASPGAGASCCGRWPRATYRALRLLTKTCHAGIRLFAWRKLLPTLALVAHAAHFSRLPPQSWRAGGVNDGAAARRRQKQQQPWHALLSRRLLGTTLLNMRRSMKLRTRRLTAVPARRLLRWRRACAHAAP